MDFEKTEALVLHVAPFQDHHCLIEIFSAAEGRQRLIQKWGKKKNSAAMAPFCLVEVVYQYGKNSELGICKEISPLNWHLGLRNALKKVEAASELCIAVRRATPLRLQSPLLYELLVKYMGFLAQDINCQAIVSSFFLKVLRHEGLWAPNPEGSTLCLDSIIFSEEEAALLEALTLTRSLEYLHSLVLPEAFSTKIKQLFLQSF